MCLVCRFGEMTIEDKKNLLKRAKGHTTLHHLNGSKIEATPDQINEIIDHAVYVEATGIDLSIDIWAIQWPNEYKAKTL